MVKVRFHESIEVGNRHTGYYRRYEKEAEFEGSAGEVSGLLINLSSRLVLPGVSRRGYEDNLRLSRNFPDLLQLKDR
ncbi:MAG: hypothetical protein ABIA75_01900 [Candidatus Neomarinimicrobiota bacterium]